MNSIKASFYILNIFAIADGQSDPSEITVIFDFLAENFEGEFNLEEEVIFLDSLSLEEKMQVFNEAAIYLKNNVSLRSKINLVEYILDLIVADNRLEKQEIQLLDYLGQIWGIDTEQLLREKLNS